MRLFNRPVGLQLLGGLVAAFLLVPAASAMAAHVPVRIGFEGKGSGRVVGDAFAPGSPEVDCHWNGTEIDEGIPAAGECESESDLVEGFETVEVFPEPDPGSEFLGWKVESGTVFPASHCREYPEVYEPEPFCIVNSLVGEDIEIIAVFAPGPNAHARIEGAGSGALVGIPEFPGEPPAFCVWDGEEERYLEEGDAIPAYLLPEYEGREFNCDTFASTAGPFTGLAVLEVAAPGSEFAGFTVEDGYSNFETCGEEPEKCQVLINIGPYTEVVIKAEFEPEATPEPHTLTVEGSAEGRVQTTEDHAINCGTRCSAEYEEGAEVELVAHSAEGAVFTEWSGGDCDESTSRFCTVTMDEDETVKAEYASAVTLTVENPGGGRVQTTGGHAINCGTRCSADYEVGASPELVAQPSSGFQFKEWEGGDCDESTSRFCSLSMSGSQTTKAVFAATVSLTVEKEGSGRVQTLENHAINCGTRCVAFYEAAAEPDVELVAQAAEGGTFVEWTSGPCAGETSRFCTVTMDGNKTAKAKFNP